eukprot:8260221-Pyramimonas_sp.AAC.1
MPFSATAGFDLSRARRKSAAHSPHELGGLSMAQLDGISKSRQVPRHLPKTRDHSPVSAPRDERITKGHHLTFCI